MELMLSIFLDLIAFMNELTMELKKKQKKKTPEYSIVDRWPVM